ncbi:MAG: ROK family protein [Candidatus Margulisbacteria bacterium]|nr:ROK family protein [Candidatus Margulisiibacteriota bacterium]
MFQLCIDIGGTKTAFGLLNSEGVLVWSDRMLTRKGVGGLRGMVQEILRVIPKQISSVIGIAVPGKLCGPRYHVVPGTGVQLGDLEDLSLLDIFEPMLPNGFSLFLINDALAQFAGGLLQLGLNRFKNNKVVYLGPGTGLGGGVAWVSPTGIIEFHTDGHFFDVLVPDEKSAGWVMAEDVLSGRGILEHGGVDISLLTQAFVSLILQIHAGKFLKAKDPWAEADYACVKGTTDFVIGGSIGTKLEGLFESVSQALPDFIRLYCIPDSDVAALTGLGFLRNQDASLTCDN